MVYTLYRFRTFEYISPIPNLIPFRLFNRENFPYYKTARDGWKNSIRHNLSLNKCFEKIENPTNGSKKGCLWALNPDKCKKLEEECKRCRQRDPVNIRLSMSRPDDLNKIERGEQRLKKFSPSSSGQTAGRKSVESNATNVHMSPVTTNGQISLSPAPNATSNSSSSSQQQQVNLGDDSFLLDWTNKNTSVILKEEVSLNEVRPSVDSLHARVHGGFDWNCTILNFYESGLKNPPSVPFCREGKRNYFTLSFVYFFFNFKHNGYACFRRINRKN